MDGKVVRRRGALLAATALAAALVLAGCGAGDDSGVEATPRARRPRRRQATAGEAGRDAAAGAAGAAGAGAPDLRVDQRAIIYTGTMRVQVDDVDAAAREAAAMVTGPVASSAATSGAAPTPTRVAELAAAGAGGAVRRAWWRRSRSWVGSRAGRSAPRTSPRRPSTWTPGSPVQRARVDSARRLLARATSITDLVSLENELGRREADLASLEAKEATPGRPDRPVHDHRVAGRAEAAKAAEEKAETGFLVGLKGGWKAFVASMTVLLTVLGALLPWLVALGVPAGGAAGGAAAGGGKIPALVGAGQRAAASARSAVCTMTRTPTGMARSSTSKRRPVQVDVGAGAAHAEPGEGAGDVLQVPGEVLAAHALRCLGDPVRAERGAGGGGRAPGWPARR